jgi:uncharacterized protein (UPF0332 family)
VPSVSWQIKPEKLIETAWALVEHHAAQGRPKQSNLRRGVSTAYYAVFHAIGWSVVTHLLPSGRRADRFALARSVDHSAIKKVCGWIANPKSAPANVVPLVETLAANAAMLNIALVFLDLMEARHRADYDHTATFAKPTAIRHVDDAESVIAALGGVATGIREGFCALIALEARKVQ